jgi:hypothetical protein
MIVPLAQNPPQEVDIAADSTAALRPPGFFDRYKDLTVQAQSWRPAFHQLPFLHSQRPCRSLRPRTPRTDDSRVDERSSWMPINVHCRRLAPARNTSTPERKIPRPADLSTPDYEQPMQTDLLWLTKVDFLSGRCPQRPQRNPHPGRISRLRRPTQPTQPLSGRVRQPANTCRRRPSMRSRPAAVILAPPSTTTMKTSQLALSHPLRQQTQGKKSLTISVTSSTAARPEFPSSNLQRRRGQHLNQVTPRLARFLTERRKTTAPLLLSEAWKTAAGN